MAVEICFQTEYTFATLLGFRPSRAPGPGTPVPGLRSVRPVRVPSGPSPAPRYPRLPPGAFRGVSGWWWCGFGLEDFSHRIEFES